MQFYASPEQIMRDRSEFARKGITRSRSVVVMSYADGVLFVAENVSKVLHKVSEIYDKIGFAAVGKYNEFENLRAAGIRMADLRGYSYDRRDVTSRAIATAYTQTLGSIFMESTKPYEVELCIAEVGDSPATDELYRITYDGQAQDEPGFLAMGGQAEAVSTAVKAKHRTDMSLTDALHLAVEALASIGGEGGKPRTLEANQLEVAVLDRARKGRKFRRITGNALTPLLASRPSTDDAPVADAPVADAPVADAPVADPAPADGDSTPKDGTAVTPAPAKPAKPDAEPAGEPDVLEQEKPLRPAEPAAPSPEPSGGVTPGVGPGGRPETGHPDIDPTTTPEVPPAPSAEE
jgi:proteasome alpha subunit